MIAVGPFPVGALLTAKMPSLFVAYDAMLPGEP